MAQRRFETSEADRDGGQIELADELRARHLLKRPIDALGALVLAAIGVRAPQQRKPQRNIFGPVLGKQEQVRDRSRGLLREDESLRAITPGDREIGAAFDQARKHVDRSAILARVHEGAREEELERG